MNIKEKQYGYFETILNSLRKAGSIFVLSSLVLTFSLTTGCGKEEKKKDKPKTVRPCSNCPASYMERQSYDGRWWFQFSAGFVTCQGIIGGQYAQCYWQQGRQ